MIVVEKDELVNMVDTNILGNLQSILSGEYEFLNQEYLSKFRLIPFSSIGKQNGLLLGFKPDFVEIEIDDNKKKIDNIIIGIYDKSITKNKEYTGLVGLDILEEKKGEMYEYTRNIKV